MRTAQAPWPGRPSPLTARVEPRVSPHGAGEAAGPPDALAGSEAKEAWLAAATETGKPIPEPRYRLALYAG